MKTILGFVDLAMHRRPLLYAAVLACFVKGSFMTTQGGHLCTHSSAPGRLQQGVQTEASEQSNRASQVLLCVRSSAVLVTTCGNVTAMQMANLEILI